MLRKGKSVPAAAVIPASLIFTNVVAVKKLVVGFLAYETWPGVFDVECRCIYAF